MRTNGSTDPIESKQGIQLHQQFKHFMKNFFSYIQEVEKPSSQVAKEVLSSLKTKTIRTCEVLNIRTYS
jgi:hypothetical protein